MIEFTPCLFLQICCYSTSFTSRTMHALSVAASTRPGIPAYDVTDRYIGAEAAECYRPQAATADSGIRVRINVRGLVFETYEQTLAQYPQTLLGSPSKRVEYYNPRSKEYCFDRDKSVFDSILFFYQSCGILSRPEHVSRDDFLEEIKFFQLHQVDKRYKHEIEPEKTASVRDEMPINRRIQRKVWTLLEYPESSKWAAILAKFTTLVIIMSTVTFCIETIPSIGEGRFSVCWDTTDLNTWLSTRNTSDEFNSNGSQITVLLNVTETHCTTVEGGKYWSMIETGYVSYFTFEYSARLLSAPVKLKFMSSPLGLVDLLAIFPYYITLLAQADGFSMTSFPVLRIIRLIRVVRILKLSRYSKDLKVLATTLLVSGKDLPSLFAVLVINIILFSSLTYNIESDVKGNSFESIPDAFWWTIITMTAVGYGDKVPKGPLGKLIGAVCAISGIVVLFCFPTPILLSHFEEMYKKGDMFGKKNRETREKSWKRPK